MSDVTVAPAATPAPTNAPAPAPAQTEVRVDTNPVTPPQPIGSQAPGQQQQPQTESRPTSRQEALQRAFDKVREKQNAKPADAKPGHNNPPEPTPKERPRGGDPEKPTIDLRKRPDEQPKPAAEEKPKDDRPRAEHGHFAPRQQQPEQQQQPGQQQPGQQQQPPRGFGPAHTQPLQRMTERAKADWVKTPESVQQDVHRMHTEYGRAYQLYKADHDEMQSLRPFQQMARESKTTLANALANYTSMESQLRNDLVGGLDRIIDNLNLVAQDGTNRKLNLLDVAWHIVNQTPEQRALMQSKNTLMSQTHQMQQMRREHDALAQQLQRMQYEQQFLRTRGALDQYATTHTRLDELGDLIEQEVKLGFDLDTAYRRAELLRPATTAPQTRNGTTAAQTRAPTTSAQTRTPDRSISGSPGGTSNGTGRSRPPVSREDAIRNALKRMHGAL